MRKRHEFASIAICAALLFSACDSSPEVTSQVTEEVTATEAVTTAETTATEASTAAETPPEPTELTEPPEVAAATFGIGRKILSYGSDDDYTDSRSPFDYAFAADHEGYIPVFSAPFETFVSGLREKDPELAGLVEPYADGDVLLPFMLRSLPYTQLYHIFDDKAIGGCYKPDDRRH